MKIKLIIFSIIILFVTFKNGVSQTEVFFLGHQFGVGARAQSMGGAFIAVADDYTATYWNPAGLSQIRRMELLGAMSHFMMENKASYANQSMLDETNATKVNAFGFVFPYPVYRGSLVFAIGYNRVRSFDSGFTYEGYFDANTDSANDRSLTDIEDGSLRNWTFSGAMEISPHLSLGASLNLWRGNDDYQWIDKYDSELNPIYSETDFIDDYIYKASINTKYTGLNFKFGVLYRLGILGRIGTTIETPLKLNAKEEWSESTHYFDNYNPEYADYHEYYDDNGRSDYGLQSPFKFAAGGAFTLFPNLIVSGDIEYADWSQMKYTTDPPFADSTKGDANIEIKKNYQATTQIRLGAEFTMPLLNLQLRAGFFNQQSPLKIASSDANRKYLTAGVGMLLDKQVKLDVTWLKGWWEDESYLISNTIPLVEKVEINKFLATLAFRF